MKVLFILHQTMTTGGSSKSFQALSQGLRSLGVEVHIAMPDQQGICSQLQAEGFPTIVLPYRFGTYPEIRFPIDALLWLPRLLARRVLYHRAAGQLAAYVRTHQIDLIHSNNSVLDVGFRVSALCHIPHVCHFREYGDKDFGFRYFPTWSSFHKRLQRPGQYAICITRDVMRHHGLNPATSRVIYNGIRHQVAALPKGGSAPKTHLLYVGRIQKAKGLLPLLEGYARYVAAGGSLHLRVIGGTTAEIAYLKLIHQFIDAHDLHDRVEFLGERNDIDAQMQQAAAFIVPSLSEAFGRCMAEAMFNGCPVIGYYTAGTQEQFDNAESGACSIGFPYLSADQLADHMLTVEKLSPAERILLTDRAFRLVNRRYTVENCASETYQFYQDILTHQTE